MKGVIFHGTDNAEQVLGALLPFVPPLHWMIDVQSYPWRIVTEPDADDLEREIDALAVDVPELEGRSGCLYRAGVLPRFLAFLGVSEWAYYIGFGGSVDHAAAAAVRDYDDLFRRPTDNMKLFVTCVCPHYPDRDGGTWVIVSPDDGLLDVVRERYRCKSFDSMVGLDGL